MISPLLSPSQLWLGVVQGSDEEAFKSLLSTMLKTGVEPSSFVHGAVTVDQTDPTKVSTEVSVSRAKSDIELWPFTDSVAISYRRVKLSELVNYFGDVVRIDLPTTAREMMSVYFNAKQLHDRSDQVTDYEIPDVGVFEVTAIPGMVFLEGAANLTVKPFQRNLTDVLETSTVDGFRRAADFATQDDNGFIVDQLTEANPDLRYPLERENLSFGQPVMISGYAFNNTQVTMEAVGDGVHKGSIEIIYTRHDFGWSTGGNQHYVEGPRTPTTQYMIDRVAAITGFPIELSDVLVETYAIQAVGQLETLTIVFNPESTRYTGELTIDYKAV